MKFEHPKLYFCYTLYQSRKHMKQLRFILVLLTFILAAKASFQVFFSKSETISIRLHPNQDIMTTITALLAPYQLTALSLASAVGSVKYCWIRTANSPTFTLIQGPLEITSLSGTIDYKLQPHIHIQLANGKSQSFGGHLPSIGERGATQDKDCPIFTTLELVLLSHQDLIYERKIDPETTFHELTIRSIYQHQYP